MMLETIGTPALWAGFIGFVLAMLALDLGVFNRKAHEVTLKEAAAWSATWVGIAIAFGVALAFWFGREQALEFFAGYLIEKALAVDNLFVFVVIFSTFAVPAALQHRVLFWGVLGALGMRAGFIFAGGALLQAFHWALYVFGALLVATGVKLLLQRSDAHQPERNAWLRRLQRVFPVAHDFDGDRFVGSRSGRWYVTPLFLALVAIELSDLVFAIDSIPAIFAVTSDPFIVFTSNILAILGLRSLYFLLSGVVTKLAYLKVGLAAVLVFVGAKMLLSGVVAIPVAASLGVIVVVLGLSVFASLRVPRRQAPTDAGDVAAPASTAP